MTPLDRIVGLAEFVCDRTGDPEVHKAIDRMVEICSPYMEDEPDITIRQMYGMTRQEAELFLFLRHNAGKIIPRNRILVSLAYRRKGTLTGKLVDVLVCRVRHKIRNSEWRIETIWGEGVRMCGTEDPPHPMAHRADKMMSANAPERI